MAHRILTHTAAALGGAVLASAVCYGLVTQGYFTPPTAPQGDLRGAKEAILDHLRKECGKEGLRGAFVDSVDERGDQLFVAGTIDQPDQESRMIEAATAALDSHAEWGRFFPKRPPVGEFATYPLRSKLLPELRTLLEVGETGVSKEKRSEGLEDLIGRVWIEDVFSDAKGKVRVLGTALVPAGAKPEEARAKVRKVVAGLLARHLPPDKAVLEPILGEDDVSVVVGVREELGTAAKESGASVWGLCFDKEGAPVVKVLGSPAGQEGGLMALLSPILTAKGLIRGDRKATLVEVRADDKSLAPNLQQKLAKGADRVGQQTRLDSVVMAPGNNRLVFTCKGLCAHAGENTIDLLRPVLTRLLASELKVKEADVVIDANGMSARPDMLAQARRLLQKESNTSILRSVRLTGLRFDPAGGLVLESPSGASLVEKVRALVQKNLLANGPSPEEQEEFIFADEPKDDDDFTKLRRQLEEDTTEPSLRYFRLDALPTRDDTQPTKDDPKARPVPYFQGVSIEPLYKLDINDKAKGREERNKLAKRIMDRLEPTLVGLEISFSKDPDPIMASDATIPEAMKADTYYEAFPNPVTAFQARIDRKDEFAGVLLFDAYYQKKGKLRLVGILRDEKQREPLRKLLEEKGDDVNPLVLRAKESPGEGLDLGGLAVATFDLRAECQKALADAGALGKHTRIDRVKIDRTNAKTAKDSNTIGLTVVGYCFHPEEGGRAGKLREALAPALKKRIEVLKKINPKLSFFPIPTVFDLNGLKYADKTFEARLVEAILAPKPDKPDGTGRVSLKGAVVTGAEFDAAGKLRIKGLVLSKAQADELERLAAEHFRAPAKDKADWRTAGSPPLVADSDGLKPYSTKELVGIIQAELAGGAAEVRRVRIDGAICLHEAGKEKEAPRLVLDVTGVALGKAADPHPAREPIRKAAVGYLAKLAPEFESLADADLRLDPVKQDLPLAALQAKVAESPDLDGTLLTDVGYDAKGRLTLLGQSPAPVDHTPLLLDVVKAHMKSALPPEVTLTAMTWKGPAKTWREMLDAIQAKLAADPIKGDPALSQSRLDRAYFVHDGNPANAKLQFAGLSLYAVLRDKDTRRQTQYRQASPDKTADVLKEVEFRDAYLVPLARTVEVEARRLVSAPAFTTSVADVRLRTSPVKEAHFAVDQALRKEGDTNRFFVRDFNFDATGNLVPVFQLKPGKGAEAVALPAILKVIEDADKKLPKGDPKAAPPFLRKDTKLLWPSAKKLPAPEKELEVSAEADASFQALLRAVRIELAKDGNGRAANSAWVAGMDLVYDGVKPPTVRLQGFFLLPGMSARGDIKTSLPPFPKDEDDREVDWVYDASALSQIDALKRLQNALADDRIDGVVFRNARYSADGELALLLAVNEVGQRSKVEAKLKADPSLFAGILAEGKGYRVVPQTGLTKWPELVENTTRSFLREDAGAVGSALPLGRYTRLDRAALRLGETWDKVELHWEGVCIYPGPADAEAIKKEARRRLAESARSVVLSGATCEVKEVGKAGTTVEANPKYAWQSGVSGKDSPDNDGILFEDAWYDKGKLRVSVLIAKGTPAKEHAQKKVVRDRIAAVKIDPRVLDAGGGTPTLEPEFALRDLPKLLEQVQDRVRASDRRLDSRVRIDRGYFIYPAARGQVEFHVSGLLLQRTPTGATGDDAARQKEVEKLIGLIEKVEIPKVSDWAGTVKLVPHLTPILDLARFLQSIVKTVRGLDGVCLLDARFDGNQLRLIGKWAGKGQHDELLELCRDFISRKRSGAIDPKTIRLDCDELDGGKVLAGLKEYAADSLDETFVDRLYFDEDGLVNVSAMSPRPEEARKLLTGRLGQLLDASAGFMGNARLSVEPGDVAVRLSKDTPLVAVAEIASILEALRAEVQWPAKAGEKGPDAKWDGMLITRCYYTPDRKFGVQGLCDGSAQRAAFATHLEGLSARGPFRGPLAGGVELTRLRAVPLTPMLAHLRRRLSGEEDFDGLSLAGASQDVTGRLLLRVDLVGPLPPDRQARAEKLVRAVIEKRSEWAERVGGGTGLVIVSRTGRDPELAEVAIRRATADLALALAACPPGGPKWRPAGIPPQDYFAVTIAQLDRARLHAPGDSTLWYLRAMVDVLLDDNDSAERAARRASRIEADRVAGNATRLRRLGATERVQGEARRITDGLLRKAKNVAPPLD